MKVSVCGVWRNTERTSEHPVFRPTFGPETTRKKSLGRYVYTDNPWYFTSSTLSQFNGADPFWEGCNQERKSLVQPSQEAPTTICPKYMTPVHLHYFSKVHCITVNRRLGLSSAALLFSLSYWIFMHLSHLPSTYTQTHTHTHTSTHTHTHTHTHIYIYIYIYI
jgi:hypothetical protein